MKMFVLCLALMVLAPAASAQTYLLVLHGIGGEPKFRTRFATLSADLIEAASSRYNIDARRIVYLAESEGTPGASGRSTKTNIESAFADLAERVESRARIFIVLIGHGSAISGSPKFQIPGPDIAAQDFATLLVPFATQEIVFVVLTSASGGFIPVLSGPRRTIITATKSDMERNETIFPVHFVAALVGDGADIDKDNRLSVSEAYQFARREVERFYAQDNRLQTEHALLDDNGDGAGTGAIVDSSIDGLVARTIFFTDQDAVIADVEDPDLVRLLKDQQRLEAQLATLRARKNETAAEVYDRELEALLLEMARVGQAIRQRRGTGS